jgi:hypothetical protein
MRSHKDCDQDEEDDKHAARLHQCERRYPLLGGHGHTRSIRDRPRHSHKLPGGDIGRDERKSYKLTGEPT